MVPGIDNLSLKNISMSQIIPEKKEDMTRSLIKIS
jgi:hypothetical protein